LPEKLHISVAGGLQPPSPPSSSCAYVQGKTRENREIQENTGEYKRKQGNTKEYRGIQENIGEYKRIQGNAREYKDYKGMQGNT